MTRVPLPPTPPEPPQRPPETRPWAARVVRRPRPPGGEPRGRFQWAPARWARTLLEYFGLSRPVRLEPLKDAASLAQFVQTRASFVAQTSLYGYLRTRAGMRYPELFDDDPFVASINVAKWQVWLACVSDLAVYAGGLLARGSNASAAQVGLLMQALVDGILDQTGVPPDAGDDFVAHAQQVRERLAACDWQAVEDGDQPFSASPLALVRWAPVIDELKKLDEGIVTNSIRFRWQEVRRDLRSCLDAPAVLGAAGR